MRENRRQQPEEPVVGLSQIATWNRILFESLIQNARANGDINRFDEVLQWNSVAGWFASRKGWFGELSSPELETELLRAARSLAVPLQTSCSRSRPRWLHVLTEAYGTLGHSNLCRRWILYDTEVVHDVMLLNQNGKAPDNLVDAVKKSGGECIMLDAAAPLLKRATDLRNHAWQKSDVIVLHTHPEDVIATTAFGVAGGPPVLLVNHADHAFWVGCSVADLIVDIRKSGHVWTKKARGVERAAILPLPLEWKHDEIPVDPLRKRMIRKELGVPEDRTVLLTVGSGHKYTPMRDLNFVETALAILENVPEAVLIAVGPRDEGIWLAARQKTGGQIRALGPQPDSTMFCRAADLYLEGFPSGSLTALLEAGEAGLPCVRAPAACIPPISSDSAGIDDLKQPEDTNDYVRIAASLARDEKARMELGENLQRAIHSWHCEEGWLAQLSAIKKLIPKSHSVNENFRPTPVEARRRDWSIEALHAGGPLPTRNTVAASLYIEAWRRTTAHPQIKRAFWDRLDAFQFRQGRVAHGLENVLEALSLWRLNRKIRRQGSRARLITIARQALACGNNALARKLIYSCLLHNLSSTGDVDWIKMLLKSHLNPIWIRKFKRIWNAKAC